MTCARDNPRLFEIRFMERSHQRRPLHGMTGSDAQHADHSDNPLSYHVLTYTEAMALEAYKQDMGTRLTAPGYRMLGDPVDITPWDKLRTLL